MSEGSPPAPGGRIRFWPRAGWVVLYALVYQVVEIALALIVVFQLGALLLAGAPNAELTRFAGILRDYLVELVDYVTLRSERRPWPFERDDDAGGGDGRGRDAG